MAGRGNHEPGKGPHPLQWKPTQEQRLKVFQMSAQGASMAIIARELGVHRTTIAKHAASEYCEGKSVDEQMLLSTMRKRASQDAHIPGSISALKYLLATRHGIHEEHHMRAVIDETEDSEEAIIEDTRNWFDEKIAQFENMRRTPPSNQIEGEAHEVEVAPVETTVDEPPQNTPPTDDGSGEQPEPGVIGQNESVSGDGGGDPEDDDDAFWAAAEKRLA